MQNKREPVLNIPSLYTVNHFTNVPAGMASPPVAAKDTAGNHAKAKDSGAGQQSAKAATETGRNAAKIQIVQPAIPAPRETVALVGVVVFDVSLPDVMELGITTTTRHSRSCGHDLMTARFA